MNHGLETKVKTSHGAVVVTVKTTLHNRGKNKTIFAHNLLCGTYFKFVTRNNDNFTYHVHMYVCDDVLPTY